MPPALLTKVHRNGVRTSRRYQSPPMPFSLSVKRAANLVDTVPDVRAVRDLQLPPGRGRFFNAAV